MKYSFVKFGIDNPVVYICVWHSMAASWLLISTKTLDKITVAPYDKTLIHLYEYDPSEDEKQILEIVKKLWQ